MGKIVSRNVVSQSKEEVEESDPSKALTIQYCLCGEFLLVMPGPLAQLSRRPADGSFVLRNTGDNKHVYKLNSVAGKGAEAAGVLVRRGKTCEFQRQLHCSRCALMIGYETVPGEGRKGPATFILSGSMTDTQNQMPPDAFGEVGLEMEDEAVAVE